jgi:hypothetical protein
MSAKKKGAYRRRDTQRHTLAEERVRSHEAGNPAPIVRVRGVNIAVDKFFEDRGMKTPSISRTMIMRGEVIGVKKWVSRK